MKQFPSPAWLSISFTILASAVLTACGGGGQAGPGDSSTVTSAPTASASEVSSNTAPAEDTAFSQTSSPSPSTISHTEVDVSTVDISPSALSLEAAATAPVEAGGPAEEPAVKALSVTNAKLPLTRDSLQAFNVDFSQNHEAIPEGVPSGYDWYLKPKKGSWNTPPAGFSSITGWGQAFWTKGTTAPGAYLLLKSEMTLVCHGPQRQWTLLQSSGVQGAVFQPDYSSNVATKAQSPGVIELGALAVGFPATTAYHFWPTMARGTLPAEEVCGTLMLVQARAQPFTASSYTTPNLLLGMGADYWLNTTAPWDNYKTNRDVAIGRLKLVKTTWAWYGLSTASNADLDRLFTNGYTVSLQ